MTNMAFPTFLKETFMSRFLILVVAIIALASTSAWSRRGDRFQDQPVAKQEDSPKQPPKSKIEEFVSRRGTLVIRNNYEIKVFTWRDKEAGGVFAVSALHLYEASRKDQGVFGLRLEGQVVPRGRSGTAMLDLTEAESLSNAIDTILEFAKENAGAEKEYLEVKFSTGDDFECGFVQQNKKQSAFLSLGSGLAAVLHSETMEDLGTLKNCVDSQIKKLKDLGAK